MPSNGRLAHQFVRSIPDRLEEGVLYVSMEFCTMIHLCGCGCGQEVVTPLSPTDWKLSFDGVAISVHPSIGNWSLNCKSHYVIRQGRICWAGQWTEEQIELGRARDRRAKEHQHAHVCAEPEAAQGKAVQPVNGAGSSASFFSRLRARFYRLWND